MPCGTPWAGSAGPLARQGWIPEVGGSVRAGAVPGLGIAYRVSVLGNDTKNLGNKNLLHIIFKILLKLINSE